ncbi:MAG: DUF952 domain-containing protein [Phycicoccus sp.]
MTEPLFHLAQPEQWDDARRLGEYRHSTRGRTLDEVGFIHLSTAAQWPAVRRRFYADHAGDLVLLTIDLDRLGADSARWVPRLAWRVPRLAWRVPRLAWQVPRVPRLAWRVPRLAWEVGDPSSSELFPHLYGPLDTRAVTVTTRLPSPHDRA